MKNNLYKEKDQTNEYLNNDVIKSYSIDKFGVVSASTKSEN
ncbi:hypothetical protein [Bacillus paramobilis]